MQRHYWLQNRLRTIKLEPDTMQLPDDPYKSIMHLLFRTTPDQNIIDVYPNLSFPIPQSSHQSLLQNKRRHEKPHGQSVKPIGLFPPTKGCYLIRMSRQRDRIKGGIRGVAKKKRDCGCHANQWLSIGKPDLAPCDFWLFPKLKSVVKGMHFASVDDIKDRMTRELKCLAEEDFANCF